MATYGSHGLEVIEVTVAPCAAGGYELVGTKLTGDVHVPAGQQSWAAAIGVSDGQCDEGTSPVLQLGDTLAASVQVADYGFADPRRVGGELKLTSRSALLLTIGDEASAEDAEAANDGESLLFRRCAADALWFVDAFNGGRLLPAAALRHTLSRAGLPPEQHAQCLAAVPPARVWARMTRNLAMHAHREGHHGRAAFWQGVECGLDDEDEAADAALPGPEATDDAVPAAAQPGPGARL